MISTRTHVGAVGLVLGGALSVQFGAAAAALLFPRAGVAGVVLLRLGIAAVVLLAVCRPRVRAYTRLDWTLISAFGAVLAGMNTMFYQAIDRIPLGPAVTLEVLGPLTLSVIAARRAVAWLWAGLALAGVTLLGRAGFDRLTPAGVAFALGAATMWAAYIVLSARLGARFAKADGLALAMAVATLLTLPIGIADAGTALLSPFVLVVGAAVAVLSSVLPYSLELIALRRMATSTFAVLMSLGPAIAAVAGFLVLGQRLTPMEGAAIALVVAASIGAVAAGRSSTRVAAAPGRNDGDDGPAAGADRTDHREHDPDSRARVRQNAYQGTTPSSSKKPPVGPSSGNVASRIPIAAPCSAVR